VGDNFKVLFLVVRKWRCLGVVAPTIELPTGEGNETQDQTRLRFLLPTVIMSEDSLAQEIQINIKGTSIKSMNPWQFLYSNTGPSELKLQITIKTDKSVLDLKKAIAEKSDVEAERQRLIYSGISVDFHLNNLLTWIRSCTEGILIPLTVVVISQPTCIGRRCTIAIQDPTGSYNPHGQRRRSVRRLFFDHTTTTTHASRPEPVRSTDTTQHSQRVRCDGWTKPIC
jgi:hypothetical protein